MNLQGIKIRIYWWLKRIVLYGLYFMICLLVGAFLILQLPSVQTGITTRIVGNFSKVSGFNVTYDRFYLVWYDRLEIDGLKIIDPKKNTMIAAERLRINFQLSNLWQKSVINIDAATLNGAQVNLVYIPKTDTTNDLNINIFVAAIEKQLSSGKPGTKGSSSAKINIGEIVLDQSAFSYNDPGADSIKAGFDYAHFRLGVPDGEIENFKVIGDTIQLRVRTLVAQDEKTSLAIRELRTFFRYSKGGMEFLDLNLKAGKSTVTDSIIFRYASPGDMSRFNTKVTVSAYLKETVIDPDDLALFAPAARQLQKPLHLDGRIEGKVSRFTYKDMKIGSGNTLLTGKLTMDGLPSIEETFITLDLDQSNINFTDLKFLFPDEVYSRVTPIGGFQVKGKFTGFVNDFVANGNFVTRLGRVESDINLKIDESNSATYSGNLKLEQFALGTYLNDTATFQKVSLNGHIAGKGLNRENANFILDGTISSIGLNGYNYLNIVTNAQFAKELFNGTVKINDPHLKFNAAGSIDLREGFNTVKLKANLDTVWLNELHLSNEKIFISSYVDIDSKGLDLDSLVGNALFKNSTLMYGNRTIHFDSIYLSSSSAANIRTLTLKSSLVDATLEGDYYYSSLFNDLANLFQEFRLNLRNEKSAIDAYYREKRKSGQRYNAKFTALLRDINPLAEVFRVNIKLSKNTAITGEFNNGPLSILHAYTLVDTIEVDKKIFSNTEIEFSGSKIRDSTEVLAVASIHSANQFFSQGLRTKNLSTEAVWNGDHVDLGIDFDQDGYNNLVRIKSEIDFLQDSTKIKILPSRIRALDREWVVDEQNYALVSGREWLIHNFELHHEDQLISIDGRISADPEQALKMDFSNLNLDILNALSTEKFTGTLNGEVTARGLYKNTYLQNNIAIKELTVNDFLVGNVTGTNVWNQTANRFDINFYIDRFDKKIVNLTGYYNPQEKVSPLSIQAQLENANLKIVEPFLKGIFSQIDGTLSGKYTISGSFAQPAITGEAKIDGGQIMIDYMKTLYTFTGSLGMTQDQIVFKDFQLTDALKNKATLKGYIQHRNFSGMTINLEGTARNFQVLNTLAKDNSLFYGQGFVTLRRLAITGPLSNLKISAQARSEKNTKIYIPINGTESIEKKDFITFTNFTDQAILAKNKNKPKTKVELSGITLDLNLEITPDALVEIIFDIKSGDIIRGRGNGDIKLQVDTKGEFNMFGSVEFTEGVYNFTLYDIINKEFQIKKGSRIAWFGDPYQGSMSITASYNQLANILPILQDQTLATSTAPALRRRYPIEVILKLEGAMLAPSINFDIDARDLPNNVTLPDGSRTIQPVFEFAAFKARLDEQELKKQVFSLIMLRRFSPYGESISTSGGLSNSVSELFSNQLSYWLSQVDQNLEIDLDLGAMDQEAFNTFQLRLSYSFLNGRLRVTRDGAFNNQYNKSDVSSIAGDWTVDYLLTPDGKFKVKMYSRSNANTISSTLGTQTAVTTGVSLLHTQNFNQLSDLLHSARERRKKELERQRLLEAEKKEEDSTATATPPQTQP